MESTAAALQLQSEASHVIEVDIQALCRICGNINDFLVPIFEDQGKENELGPKINQHLPIQVIESDSLPLKICINCITTLLTFNSLVNCCTETNKRFQDIILSPGVYEMELKSLAIDDEVEVEMNDENVGDVSDCDFDVDQEENDDEYDVEYLENEIPPSPPNPNKRVAKQTKKSVQAAKEVKLKLIKIKAVKATKPTRTTRSTKKPSTEQLKVVEVVEDSEIVELLEGEEFKEIEEVEGEDEEVTKKPNSASDKVELNIEKFVCDFGCSEFELINDYIEHMELHLLTCNICEKSFDTILETNTHIKKHNTDPELTCEHCGFIESTVELLNDHIELHNIKNINNFLSNFKCKHCELNFSNETELKAHKENCKSTNFFCNICDKSFKRKYNMEKHLVNHQNDNPCQICCSSFITKISLQQHFTNHEKSEMLNYDNYSAKVKCNYCPAVFNSKLIVYWHERDEHLKLEKYQCELCCKIFKTKSILETHQKKHLISHICKICDKKFSSPTTLQDHMRTHTKEKPFNCEICSTSFRCRSNYLQHLQKHSQTKNYKCSFCDLSFTRSTTLKDHINIHLNIKSHKCKYCLRCYTQYSVLSKHMSKIHRVCEICHEMIGDKMKMQVHMWKKHPKIESDNGIE